jgi:hypothetical protein
MADQTTHHLAELVAHVMGPLPFTASAQPVGTALGAQLVAVQRRNGDRYLANWPIAAPMPGDDIELVSVRDTAVYTATARITGIDRGNARYLTITELRRKTQRRQSPRAAIDDLVLISEDGDIDGTLTDVSAEGLGFLLDRPLNAGTTIRTVINLHGSIIPATANVKNIKQTSDGSYRIGCHITQITDPYRAILAQYAADHTAGRRSTDNSLRHRLRRTTS